MLSDEAIATLAERDINGRQIKNACRTASSLALSRGEKVKLEHVQEALDAMEELVSEFTAEQLIKAWWNTLGIQRFAPVFAVLFGLFIGYYFRPL